MFGCYAVQYLLSESILLPGENIVMKNTVSRVSVPVKQSIRLPIMPDTHWTTLMCGHIRAVTQLTRKEGDVHEYKKRNHEHAVSEWDAQGPGEPFDLSVNTVCDTP